MFRTRFSELRQEAKMMAMPDKAKAIAEPRSAQNLLLELQVEQHHHDETYHREIARLSLHQRLNHMALHFAKYAGKVAAADTIEGTVPVFVDTLIIALSTANILNARLWDILPANDREFPGLLAYGRALGVKFGDTINDRGTLLRETVIAAGRMAAACEKIDHLEEISFREEIRQSIARLSCLSLAVIASQGVDPAQAIRERLNNVKQRLFLHGRI